jgi:glycosyltransferase involved in cell wall biosynthesis
MRIAQLVDDLDFGGLQQIVAQMSIRLRARGHSVAIVCLREAGGGVSQADLQAAGVQVVELKKQDGFQPAVVRRLTDYLRAERIQVLNSHNHVVHHYAAIAGRAAAVPAVLNTLHGTATLVMSHLAKLLFWASCMATNRVVCVSPQVYEVFSRRFALPRNKLTTIDNGINLAPFLALPGRPSGPATVFGNVGRMVEVKDQSTLLRAFAEVLRSHPQARLRILGGGPLKDALRQEAESLGISGSVEFPGFSRDVVAFLADIDIYVGSSLSEGLPLTVLEALGAGRPVVFTAVGGVPDLAGKTGGCRLCPSQDPHAMAAAMAAVMNSPDPKAMEEVRRTVTRLYSVDRMTDDYVRLYEELLEKRDRPSSRA